MLFVTDVIIGIYSNMWLTYGLMGVIGVISRVLHDGKYSTLMGSSALSVVLWHLIINIPWTFPTIIITEALLFDLRLLGSTMVFASVFYAIHKAITPLAEVIYLNKTTKQRYVSRN